MTRAVADRSRPVIGYYVHHVGQGHLQRATAVATELRCLGASVTGLSSLPRPSSWPGEWRQLPRDDDPQPVDATAGGVVHWAPLGHTGLRSRMGAIAGWIAQAAPSAFVSDLSVEVTALVRLHGVPVATTVLPGRRDDRAHQLGFQLADAIIAPWPDLAPGMCHGLEPHAAKVTYVGGLSRFDGSPPCRPVPRVGVRQVLLLSGAGGESAGLHGSRAACDPVLPRWRSTRRGPGRWVADPWPDLCAADVVVTHGGLGAVSDVAAARKPAVVIPEARPHDEQGHTAAAVATAGLAVVLDRAPCAPGAWESVLEQALSLDPHNWARWSGGDAASRCAKVIIALAGRSALC